MPRILFVEDLKQTKEEHLYKIVKALNKALQHDYSKNYTRVIALPFSMSLLI